MDSKDILFTLLALILFLAAAYYIAQYGLSISPEHDEHGDHGEPNEAELLYFKSLEFDPGDNYSKTYSMNSDGLEKKLTLVVNGEEKYLELSTAFHKERIYYLKNETTMCLDFGSDSICSNPVSLELTNHLTSMERNFISLESNHAEKERDEFLLEKGGLHFSDHIHKSDNFGQSCDLFESSIDFKKLSLHDLSEIGLNQNSPEVSIYSNYSTTFCITEKGEQLFKNFTYFIAGFEKYTIKSLINSSEAVTISLPEELQNETELKSLYDEILSTKTSFYQCIYDEDSEGCFKEKAVYSNEEYYCTLAGSQKDNCYNTVGTALLDVGICAEISNQSKKDDCHFGVAIGLEDVLICELIEDESSIESCETLLLYEEIEEVVVIPEPDLQ